MPELRPPVRAKIFERLYGNAYRPHAQNGLPKMPQKILAKESYINSYFAQILRAMSANCFWRVSISSGPHSSNVAISGFGIIQDVA